MASQTIAAVSALMSQQGNLEAPFQAWSIGVEREVDEGVYGTLLSERNGWRIWRFEQAARYLQEDPSDRTSPPPILVTCYAIKPIESGGHPAPTGEGRSFSRKQPYLIIERSSLPWWRQEIAGRNRYGSAQVRPSGARYWTRLEEVRLREGDRIEVHVESWVDQARKTGHWEERGTLNLDGLEDAKRQASECSRATSSAGTQL